MSATDPLTSGWLHGCSLPSFVREHASVLAEIPFAVVTMVDSSAGVSQMPWALPWTHSAQRSASSALVVSAASLVEILEEEPAVATAVGRCALVHVRIVCRCQHGGYHRW